MRVLALIIGVVGLLILAPGRGASSIVLAGNATRVTLRVDARGYAEIGWTTEGVRQYVVVPPRGRVLRGRRLTRRDVSRPYTRLKLPFQRALRRTPDGRLWAVQAWRGGAHTVDLHFARWRGEPTVVILSVPPTAGPMPRLIGQATFHAHPVTGFSTTPSGIRFRHFAYLDCFACPAAQPGEWARMLAVATRADGSFGVVLRPEWVGARYRATVAGPTRGATFAPDGSATAEPGPPPPPPVTNG